MKKLVLTSICTVAMAAAAMAQGTVNWSVIAPTGFSAQTNSTQYSALFGGGATGTGAQGKTTPNNQGTTYYYELLYTSFNGTTAAAQPTTFSQLATWSDANLGATNALSYGNVAGIQTGTTTAETVPWANGTTNSVMFVGWSANLGTTWSAALANMQNANYLSGLSGQAFFGESVTGYINPRAGNPGAGVFGTAATADGLPIAGANTQLYLIPVPEPGTIAMAALGGLSLLAFRRKK